MGRPAMRVQGSGAAVLSALLLGGCATVAGFKGIGLDEDVLFVSGLPPITQDSNFACGPTCVAAVAAYWDVSLADFKARHPRLPDDATGNDLQRWAEDLGLPAFVYRGSLDDMHENLMKGRPLIVMISRPLVPGGGVGTATLLNLWNELGPKPAHWVVALGGKRNQFVIIHDPASGTLVVKERTFQKWWAAKENLTVLITGP